MITPHICWCSPFGNCMCVPCDVLFCSLMLKNDKHLKKFLRSKEKIESSCCDRNGTGKCVFIYLWLVFFAFFSLHCENATINLIWNGNWNWWKLMMCVWYVIVWCGPTNLFFALHIHIFCFLFEYNLQFLAIVSYNLLSALARPIIGCCFSYIKEGIFKLTLNGFDFVSNQHTFILWFVLIFCI